MAATLLRPFNIDVAHKPTCKLRSNFTKHKDKTRIAEKHNAIYISFLAKTVRISTLDKYLKRFGQDYQNTRTQSTDTAIAHFQLNTQTTTDINSTGLKRDA
jgi:hypothetical protein